MSTPTVHELATEARLSAQEFAGFIEQCGKTADALYRRDDAQMARMRERLFLKTRLADYMEARSKLIISRGHQGGDNLKNTEDDNNVS